MNRIAAFFLGLELALGPASQSSAATLSNLIVDQFGWRTGSAKVAILAQPQSGQGSPSSFTPGTGFEIRRVSDNALVYSNTVTAWNGGATQAQSGDKGWWADFSAVSTPGSYYLALPGGSNPGAQSYAFDLREDVYADVLKASVRSYYYQRCGIAIDAAHGGAWTHAVCHDATESAAHLYNNGDQGAGTARDVRGGWHDAGDYRKYTSFNYSLIWDLMTAFEWNPCAFGDATGIPESGNGVPDILDELKWELDWLLRMQEGSGPNAGALYSGVFVTAMGSNSGEGDPSLENTQYWYANYSSGASSTGCMALAKGARLFQAYAAAYPGYAATLQAAAEAAWAWLQAHPGNVTYDHTGFNNANANIDAADDFGRRLGAAAELYRLTGDPAYRTYFDANYNSSAGSVNGGTYHPILNNEFWPSAALSLEQACVSYCQAPGASAGVVSAIKTALKNGADNRVLADQNAGTDLYRGYMWDGYYGWGSNNGKSRWGGLAVWAWKLGLGSPAEQLAYQRAGEEYLHYIHGRNPLNWCYLSNMGPEGANAGAEQSVNEIYHSWFADGSVYDGFSGGHIGPAPGILVGGTNQFYATDTANSGGTAAYPPAGQPILKSFRNWNKVWPDCSWSVTENSIGYQGPYTFLVAMYAPCSGPQPTATPSATPTNYAGSPTATFTATASPSATVTPTPVCQTLLNGAETLAENGTWSGGNALRSIVAAGSAPAGAVTQGGGALYVNVTVSAGWNDNFANLAGFSPTVWTPFSQLKVDVYAAAGLVAGGTYKEVQLRADCASCAGGAGLWYQPISADAPALVAGAQTLTWTLDFSQGTIPAGSALSKLTLVYNNDATAPTGALYLDNLRLLGACGAASATPSPSATRTQSPAPSATPSASTTLSASPSASATATSNPTPSATPSPGPAGTATGTATPAPTVSASPSPSQTGSPSATRTWAPTPVLTPLGCGLPGRIGDGSVSAANDLPSTGLWAPKLSNRFATDYVGCSTQVQRVHLYARSADPGAYTYLALYLTWGPLLSNLPATRSTFAGPFAVQAGWNAISVSLTAYAGQYLSLGVYQEGVTWAAEGTSGRGYSYQNNVAGTVSILPDPLAELYPDNGPAHYYETCPSCGSATPTDTPFISPSASVTHSPTRTATATWTPLVTVLSTASRTRSPTPYAGTPSPAATLTPAPSPSPTPTASETPSPALSPTPSLGPSPALTATPSSSPAAAGPSPSGADGSLLILDAAAWPQPNPRALLFKLSGPAERVRIRLYSPAWVLAWQGDSAPSSGGWDRRGLATADLEGLGSGLYYAVLQAERGRIRSPRTVVRIYLLR